jgi:large subunit ribosomal protein L30
LKKYLRVKNRIYFAMAKIKITQVRSGIHCTKRQKLNLQALGLRKMNAVVEHEATPQILGMIEKVKHLLKVTEV